MWTEQDRSIYGPYFNGSRNVYGDPMKIHRRFTHALEGDPGKWVDRWNETADPIHWDARERVIQAGGFALEMMPFNPDTGEGATEALVEAVLRDFLAWLEKNDSRGGSSQTSPAASPAVLQQIHTCPQCNCGSTSAASEPRGPGT